MGVDVVDPHRDRNLTAYLILRSSSAAAKNAADVFKISFARRNSRTSRSNSAIRAVSSLVVPGRTPSSISACLTQVRNASGWIPNWSAIRLIAPVAVAGSRRASNAILVARSRNSWLYFFGAATTLILPAMRAPTEPGAIHCNAFVRFRAARNNTMIMTRGTSPAKVSPRMKDRFGYVADLGKVDVPPRSWGDIASRIDPSVDLERRIRQHTVSVVALSYFRGDHPGALVVEVWPTTLGTIAVRRLHSSPNTEVARASRAGVLAPAIRNSKVAVVGTGALGSFIADMLVRAGVRHLTLIDGDVVMPGNVVRHVAGEDAIGRPKPDAVKEQLGRHDPAWARDIVAVHEPLTSGADASELIAHNDLVVDATADFATTALLHLSAASSGAHILSAVILDEGATCRIDLLPPLDDAPLLPPSTSAGQASPGTYETGCGSPISATPPHAVIEAAAVATRHVVGILTGKPVHPSGEIRALLPAVEGVPD